jgi:signal transduction histidine kinase
MVPEFQRSGIEVTWLPGCPQDEVMADPKRLKGVLLNLFVNAIEAQPTGGAMRVSTRVGRHDGGPTIDVVVADAGPGVAASIRDRIFQPFFTTKPSGSGIGLAISREALRAHSGELVLDYPSTPASGATFRLILPLTDPVADGLDPDWLRDTRRTTPSSSRGPTRLEAVVG